GYAQLAQKRISHRPLKCDPPIAPWILPVCLVSDQLTRENNKAMPGRNIILIPHTLEGTLPANDMMDQIIIPHLRAYFVRRRGLLMLCEENNQLSFTRVRVNCDRICRGIQSAARSIHK